jgi:hypothetical protein
MTPEQIIELLGLQRGTCGYMASTHISLRCPRLRRPEDHRFERGDAELLQRRHPEFAERIAEFASA